MDKQLRKSYRDDQREYIQQQNAICSRKFLDALIVHHAPAQILVEAPLPEPEPLPPIPNEEIAKAAELAFPKYINRISEIQRLVLKEFPKITLSEVLSRRRKKHIVLARHIGMYIARRYTNKSFPEIGRRYGGMDHSSILHGVARIERLIESDPTVAAIVNRLEQQLMVAE